MVEATPETHRPVVPRPSAVGRPEHHQLGRQAGKHRAAIRQDRDPGIEALLLQWKVVPHPGPAGVERGEGGAEQPLVRRILGLARIAEVRHQDDAGDEVAGIPGIGGEVRLDGREPRRGAEAHRQVLAGRDRTGARRRLRARGTGEKKTGESKSQKRQDESPP